VIADLVVSMARDWPLPVTAQAKVKMASVQIHEPFVRNRPVFMLST
jgi:hypothetical protein